MHDDQRDYQIDAECAGGYLRVRAHGTFGLARTLRLIDFIAAESERHACLKVLIDVTALAGQPSTIDQFEIARATAERLRLRRIAVLAATEALVREGFGDTVAYNRGGQVRSFTIEQQALAWLLGS